MSVVRTRNVAGALTVVETKTRAVVLKYATEILRESRERVPVLTGTLKNSSNLQIEDMGQKATVYYSAEYAAFVELGTSKMGPRPYLGPAVVAKTGGFRYEMERAVN